MNGKKPDRPLLYPILTVLLTVFSFLASAGPADSEELTIIYSNDIRGETEPCG